MITDFHSHILPGIDDGSPDAETSIEMLRRSAEQGITRIVATPHFYPRYDSPDAFLARREAALSELNRAKAGMKDLPHIETGAEVYYFPGMSDSEALSGLTIGQSRSILIEMPPAPWTDSMFRELEWIYTKQDLLPVLAHIDRYIRPLRTYGILRKLERLPVLVQANADFFLRAPGWAMKLLREERIHVLGSDCHGMEERIPNLGPAVEQIVRRCGSRLLDQIRENESKILENR